MKEEQENAIEYAFKLLKTNIQIAELTYKALEQKISEINQMKK